VVEEVAVTINVNMVVMGSTNVNRLWEHLNEFATESNMAVVNTKFPLLGEDPLAERLERVTKAALRMSV
jgi:hypothetical protein